MDMGIPKVFNVTRQSLTKVWIAEKLESASLS
jgi:hypothetical protein